MPGLFKRLFGKDQRVVEDPEPAQPITALIQEPPTDAMTDSTPDVLVATTSPVPASRPTVTGTKDWRPLTVKFATFDSFCDYCGTATLALLHRVVPTDHYGWIHYDCSAELDNRSHRPKSPTPAADAAHQCEGTKKDGQRCSRQVAGPKRTVSGEPYRYFCSSHSSQAPADLPDEHPSRVWRARVAGVTFVDGYPHTINRVAPALAETNGHGERIPAILERDPGNEYDPNAVRVHIPMVNSLVGHLPKESALKVAPILDGGGVIQAQVSAVVYNDDNTEQPGIEIAMIDLRRPDDLEQ